MDNLPIELYFEPCRFWLDKSDGRKMDLTNSIQVLSVPVQYSVHDDFVSNVLSHVRFTAYYNIFYAVLDNAWGKYGYMPKLEKYPGLGVSPRQS